MIFSIDSAMMSMPAIIMMIAIRIVVMRSMRLRYAENFWWPASFSLTMIRKPEMESIKLWTASEVMASEPARRPTMILKTPRKKLAAIKR